MKKTLRQIIRIISFIILIALYILLRRSVRHSGFTDTTVVLLIGTLAATLSVGWLEMGWYYRFARSGNRIKKGDAQAVLKESLSRRERGDRSITTSMALAGAYMALGRGVEAEQVAREVWNEIEKSGDLKGKSLAARARGDLATLALYESIAVQGRFAEAAQEISRRIPDSAQTELMAVTTAWYYFLAGNNGEAHQILKQYFPKLSQGRDKLKLSDKYKFITLYMAYKLFGADTRPALSRLQGQLAEWEREALQAGSSPYAVRLYEVINDMRTLMGLKMRVVRPIG